MDKVTYGKFCIVFFPLLDDKTYSLFISIDYLLNIVSFYQLESIITMQH